MSLNKIYTAFATKINTITPQIATVWENKKYDPVVGVDYQEVYILPSSNNVPYINETSYEMEGLVQITLCYGYDEGRSKAMDRANLYMGLFPVGTVLTIDSLKIRIKGVPQITNLGVDNGRYKIALRVGFLAVL